MKPISRENKQERGPLLLLSSAHTPRGTWKKKVALPTHPSGGSVPSFRRPIPLGHGRKREDEGKKFFFLSLSSSVRHEQKAAKGRRKRLLRHVPLLPSPFCPISDFFRGILFPFSSASRLRYRPSCQTETTCVCIWLGAVVVSCLIILLWFYVMLLLLIA